MLVRHGEYGRVNGTVKGSSTHKMHRPWELMLTRNGGGFMPFALKKDVEIGNPG
jgi:hypothetical protein